MMQGPASCLRHLRGSHPPGPLARQRPAGSAPAWPVRRGLPQIGYNHEASSSLPSVESKAGRRMDPFPSPPPIRLRSMLTIRQITFRGGCTLERSGSAAPGRTLPLLQSKNSIAENSTRNKSYYCEQIN
ncbi:hypothetical protein HVIM_03972 [Roseomonas mucosa]|nr:hypothetical protein HVIM_03972 [Roseomonas mucosa]QDD98077.1 hypothetical protein ADP8_03972 [Roseomonas mucosa]UZO90270.1 Hypothetical protein RMP42_03972 [Roseomonas mucosa]